MSRERITNEFRAQIAITNNMSYDACLLMSRERITNEFMAQNAITRCTGLGVRNLHNIIALKCI